MSEATLLAATDVRKSFMTGTERLDVLTGVSVNVEPAQTVSIVGDSGCGKSTLLHLLGALDRPTEGDIRIDGVRLGNLSDDELADLRNRTIGFVFQFHHLLPEFNALENVMMPALVARDTAEQARVLAAELLAEVGLAQRLHHKPRELSGGEQQRVAVARALVNRPKLLLCDEPTGNLDKKHSEQLHELLWQLNYDRDTSIVVVTHDENLAGAADRKYRLAEGILRPVDG